MSFEEIASIIIIPVLALVSVFSQSPDLKSGLTKRAVIFIAVSLGILGFSVIAGLQNMWDKNSSEKQIVGLNDSVSKLNKTIEYTADKIDEIGLSIDENTGKLLLMDSALLKKEFSQVFNITTVDVTPIENERLLAAVNFSVSLKDDILSISPKSGTWAHAYFIYDTSGFGIIDNITQGQGSIGREQLTFEGKNYITYRGRIYNRSIYPGNPIKLIMRQPYKKFIIFGDDGVLHARYIYENGKVRWIPED